MHVLNPICYILAVVGLIAIVGRLLPSKPQIQTRNLRVSVPVTIALTRNDPEAGFSVDDRMGIYYTQVSGWGRPGHTLTPAYSPAKQYKHTHNIDYFLYAQLSGSEIELQEPDELHLEIRDTGISDRKP